MIKNIFFFCVLTCFFFSNYSQSQIYPIQVNANLIPPYSLYLSDYVSGSRDHLNLIMLNKDIDCPSMPVRLRLTIKGGGVEVIEYTTGKGMTPKSVFAYSPEVFRKIITSISDLYGKMSTLLEVGRSYAWVVRVVGKDGAKWTNVLYVERV